MGSYNRALLPTITEIYPRMGDNAQAIGTTTMTLDFTDIVTRDPENYRRWVAGVVFYDAAGGLITDAVFPTAATATFTIKTPVQPQGFQAFTDANGDAANAIDCSAVGQVNFSTNLTAIKVDLSSVTAGTATHWRLFVKGNIS